MRGPTFAAWMRRSIVFGAVSGLAVVAACSTDNVLAVRPSVDVGETGGIYNVQPIPSETFRETEQGTFEAREPEQFAAPQEPAYEEPAQDIQPEAPEEQMTTPAMTPEQDYFGEQSPSWDDDAAASQNGGDPSDEQYVPQATETDEEPEPQASIRPLPQKRTMLAGFPRVFPRTEPSISAEEAACRKELKRAGVRYQDLAPIRDSRTCYIDNPVKVTAIGNIQMKPAATLTCRMALTFAKWTNKELAPSVRWRYFTGIKTIRQGSSYSCRRIAGSGTPSAHSTGNALDVMAVEFNNGKTIDVRKQGFFAFRAKKLLNNVRADGCEYFSTVLGPGYNYDHRDHFHFDLMERRSGRRACH
jgi:hypothetical protein